MREHNYSLGGESSGHIICSDLTTTGDAIVAALQVLQAVVDTGKDLRTLLGGMQKTPQILINVRTNGQKDCLSHPVVTSAVAEAERDLSDKGRVLLRASGTEPVIRVMVEGESSERIQQHAESIAEQIRALS